MPRVERFGAPGKKALVRSMPLSALEPAQVFDEERRQVLSAERPRIAHADVGELGAQRGTTARSAGLPCVRSLSAWAARACGMSAISDSPFSIDMLPNLSALSTSADGF